MKLTKDQKADLKFLKSQVKTHMGEMNTVYLDGFATIVFVRNFKRAKMVSVAVSYFDQNEDDKFRKSTGQYFAVDRLFEGEFVQMPLGDLSDPEIAQHLADSFG